MIDMQRTGAHISGLRKDHHLTQAELAARLMVTPQAVSKWETGQALPDSGQLLAMSQLFDVTINSILTGERAQPQTWGPTTAPEDELTSKPLITLGSHEEDTQSTLLSIVNLAHFIDKETLAQLLLDCDWVGATFSQLETLFTFLDSEVVDRCVDKVPPTSPDELLLLAPYVSAGKLSALVEQMESHIALDEFVRIAHLLVPETCSRVFVRLLHEPGDHKFEDFARLAHYVTSEAMEELVTSVPPRDYAELRRVAPFLDKVVVSRVAKTLRH